MARISSVQPRKQRKARANTPHHRVTKEMAAHLSDELIKKYKTRSLPVRKGDTVKIVRGSHKGHTDKVAGVFHKKRYITVDGATVTKADQTQEAKKIDPSNVIITKVELTDPWRKKKIASLGGTPE